MRASVIQITAAAFMSFGSAAFGADLAEYEKTCAELGFKKRTPAFGECVLELDRRSTEQKNRAASVRAEQKPPTVPPPPQPQTRPMGDGSPDDVKCQEFGWDVGTLGYAGCRQQLYQLRADQEQYRQALAAYQERVKAHEREAERQRGMRALEMSARLLGGGRGVPSGSSLGPAPVAPVAPPSMYTVQDRYGRSVNCTAQTTGSITNVICY
jgi:hypothetical protein